jgi:hypothetical protein
MTGSRPRWALAVLAGVVLGIALLPGCAKQKRGNSRRNKPATKGGEPMQAEIKKGHFIVEEQDGTPVMNATADKTVGLVQPGADSNGPVTFTNVDAWMYKNGRKDARIQAPTAVWQNGQLRADQTAHVETADGKMKADAARALWAEQVTTMWTTSALMYEKGQLKARVTAPEAYYKDDQLFCDKTAHAETPDGKMKLDAQKAVYHQPTAKLMLTTVTGRQYEAGKPVMQAQGPQAEFQNDVLVLPATGLARRLDDGSTISAKVVRWNRATGKIDATGDVRFNTPSARGVGQRFLGSSTLKKGTLSGRPRPRVIIRRQAA